MADDDWIAYRGAVALIGDEGAVLRALRTGAISRGRGDHRVEEDIPADRWAQWTFLPTKGSEYMRRFCWLVPPRKEQVRVCTGFGEIRLLRADVERLAAPTNAERLVEEKEAEPERPRSNAGRKAKYVWFWVEQYLEELFAERGDPNDPGQEPGWNSDEDVANAVLDRFEKHAKKGEAPALGTVQNYIRPLLVNLRARNARNATK